MLLLSTISDIRSHLREAKKLGKKIAFVPTMGALHAGHFSLINQAKKYGEIVVVSIFVNKTQFNDVSDFEKYPRQLEQDLAKLEGLNVDFVFAPESEEMFGENFSLKIIPTALTDSLCGATRPGHFEGVALVVSKLFNIINPDVAVFGEKDFQQLAIIKKLVSDLNFDIKIVGAEIMREASGLAMSSRNQRLSEDAKTKAAEIYKILCEIRDEIKNSPQNYDEIIAQKKKLFLDKGFERIDYLEVRDEKNLSLFSQEFLEYYQSFEPLRVFAAVSIEGVRLIDNVEFKLNEKLPRIAQKKSYVVKVEAGKKYSWCSCGMSAKEPFCDGTHKKFKNSDGTSLMKSVKFEATEDKIVYFCGCKHSKSSPFCDGTHKTLR